jgi:hypothetical protein
MLIHAKIMSVAAVAAAALVGATAPQASPDAAEVTSVQPKPAPYTPSIATSSSDGSTEVVRQLTPCGGTMYAAGRFTLIHQAYPTSTNMTRNNAFSFNAGTGAITSWNPNVNGQVNSIAVSPDCATVYLGGSFTNVGGTTVSRIAAVSASTGAVLDTFAHSANGKVDSLVLTKAGHLLVGGEFSSINGSSKKYLVSLNPVTGLDDGYVDFNISGRYVYTQQDGRQSAPNATQVYNMQLSPDGNKLLAEGVFTSVGGQARRQIFMADLGVPTATVDLWYSPEFDQNCYVTEPFYLQAASWAPDMSKVYTVTTGYKPASGLGFKTSDPRAGLCDSVAAFPATSSPVLTHLWINYTGCDSLFSTAADASTVYVGGHERWANNPRQCDNNNDGKAVSAPGMGGFNIGTGDVLRSATNPQLGLYTRSRGQGADDMVITAQGLWIASDNGTAGGSGSTTCGGVGGKAGICFLPY